MKTRFPLLALVVAALSAAGASAQSVTSLTPSAWRTTAGRELVVVPEARATQGVLERAPRRVEWLFHRAGGALTNFTAFPDADSADDVARFEARALDTHLVGADFQPRVEVVAEDELAAFRRARLAPGFDLHPCALDESAPPRAVRVRRYESAAVLVVAEDGRGKLRNSANAQAKTGQRMELRPLVDPTATTAGNALPLRIYAPPGVPHDLRVRAHRLGAPFAVDARADREGIVALVLDGDGPWIVEAHALARATSPGAEWELYSVTLAFHAPAAPPRDVPERTEDDR